MRLPWGGWCVRDTELAQALALAHEPGMPHLGGVGVRDGVPGFAHSGQELPDVAFLRFLESEHGIRLAWEDTQALLPTAAFARSGG